MRNFFALLCLIIRNFRKAARALCSLYVANNSTDFLVALFNFSRS